MNTLRNLEYINLKTHFYEKKFTLVVVFTVILLNAISQSYFPLLTDSNSWYISSYFEICETKIFWTSKDTLISNKQYKILRSDNCSIDSDTCNIGYLREDTTLKKLFAKLEPSIFETDTSEFVMYDFSLNVNDSIFLLNPNFYSQWWYYGIDTLGWHKIDSIIIGNTIAGQRKYFYLHKCSNIYSKMTWIEGIGAINGDYVIMQGSGYCWTHCKFNESNKQYVSDEFYYLGWDTICSCSYLNVESSLPEKEIKIYPVPFTAQTVIELPEVSEYEIYIADISGKNVYRKNFNGVDFSVGKLEFPSGFYCYCIKNKKYCFNGKFVVQ